MQPVLRTSSTVALNAAQSTFRCEECNEPIQYRTGIIAKIAHMFGMNVQLNVVVDGRQSSVYVLTSEAHRIIGLEEANAGERIGSQFARVLHKRIGESAAQKGDSAFSGRNGVEQDVAAAVRLYRLAADQGNADAQYSLGFMYDIGWGVDENLAEAVKWYKLAADQRYPEALCTLGDMYENRRGVDENLAEAVKWYRLADAQGDAVARNNLRRLELAGRIV